jgi:hypothetical protein
VSAGVFTFFRRSAVGAGLVTSFLAFVGKPSPRKGESRSAGDEVTGPNAESVLLTRTAPPGTRWIELSRWEDLVKASRFMGRPILRLDDGTRSLDQPLFYVPDGPQSYVFDLQREGLNASTSGGYAPAPVPEAAVSTESLTPTGPETAEWDETPPADERLLPAPDRRPGPTAVPPPEEVSLPSDETVEQYLGPDVREPEGAAGAPEATKVEREIREMIYHVLAVLRNLPPSSDQVGPGTVHIQRALELLRRGRYGSAQIEVNRAARLLLEEHQT